MRGPIPCGEPVQDKTKDIGRINARPLKKIAVHKSSSSAPSPISVKKLPSSSINHYNSHAISNSQPSHRYIPLYPYQPHHHLQPASERNSTSIASPSQPPLDSHTVNLVILHISLEAPSGHPEQPRRPINQINPTIAHTAPDKSRLPQRPLSRPDRKHASSKILPTAFSTWVYCRRSVGTPQ